MKCIAVFLSVCFFSFSAFVIPATAYDFDVKINIGSGKPAASQPQKASPPPWAPAHGVRAKYQYDYYPDAEVYFDPGRSIWFFFHLGEWVTRGGLPERLKIQLKAKLTLDMDNDRPYLHHSKVKGRHPGKVKVKPEKTKKKGKGKGRGKKR